MRDRTVFPIIFSLLAGIFLICMVVPVQAAGVDQKPLQAAVINAALDSAAKSAAPGTAVTYLLTVSNSGDEEAAVVVSGSDEISISPAACEVAAGGSCVVNLQVVIPSDYVDDQFFTSSVTVTGSFSGSPIALSFTTTAVIESPTPTPFSRPLLVIESYTTGGVISPGSDFNLQVKLYNNGGSEAKNVVAVFESTDFLPLQTGGVLSVASIRAGNSKEITQPMRAADSLWGASSGAVVVNVSYTDRSGTAYTENFTLTIGLQQWSTTGAAAATPTLQPRAQLVVGSYSADVDPLQPGTIFNLSVQVYNLGTVDASGITMVLGGGVVTQNSDGTGTQNNGVSASGSDLATFAPLGTSNLIYMGRIPVGQVASGEAQLIVNVSANPGAYPFKLSFTYLNEKGERVVDDQVITLLVYNLPKMDIGVYRDPGVFMAGSPNMFPLQITNLGKTTAVLGNLKVTCDGADISEGVALVGNLESGGYFTIDALVTPYSAGELELVVTVNYSDDFNQPQVIEQRITVTVEEPFYEPLPGEENPEGFLSMEQEETFGQKLVRFLKGMLGLGSARPESLLEPYPMPDGAIEETEPEVIPGAVGGKG